ncbi:MAG TPA: hypothetical protein VEX60_14410 [Pyrinomonadaceae bacterium]|nr:hypothetical protein [Pyrinomonadaceae bacterium]
MKRRIITLVIFLLLSSLTFVYPRPAPTYASLEPGIEPQRSGQTRRRARRRARPARPRIDYSRFNHSRAEHRKQSCDSCHIVWAIEEKTQEMNSDSLDIKDFPEHESCLDCHRQQFFRGARPVICSNCHTVVSPRSDARFEFPKKNAASQFDNVFPHANHVKSTMLGQFKRISGPSANLQSTCNYCHKPNKTDFKPAKGAPADTFAPPAGTFMTTPSSHVTCFQCHFQKGVENRETPPLATECVKCHVNIAAAPATTPTPKPAPTPAKAATATGTDALTFAIVSVSMQTSPQRPPAAAKKPAAPAAPKAKPAPTPIAAHNAPATAWPERIVLKFAHDKDAHKKKTNDDGKEVAITCLQCHTAARKAETLADMRKKESKVQLSSCSSSGCHTATSGTAQLGLSVYRELRELAKERKPDEKKFECDFCHTKPYSTKEAPCSHYAAVLASATKEKKSTKGIEQLTPQRCGGEQKK